MAEGSIAHQGTASADGLQPGHDIFRTPHNDLFYATKLHSELDPTQHQIRLVKLWPGTEDDVIECTLLPGVPLVDKKGQYTAPSYCAGSAKNTESIILNGKPFNVFANLAHSLREVRNFWASTHGDRECILWIDQISTNQSDIKERSHQVRFMREIYQYAEQVLVCLSTEKVDPRGMNWLVELARDASFCHLVTKSEVYDDIPDNQECAEFTKEDIRMLLNRHVYAKAGDEEFFEGWLAFYKVIEAPWFTRAWVFQEFMVAANIYFMYSGTFASWRLLYPLWTIVCSWEYYNHPMFGSHTDDRPAYQSLHRTFRYTRQSGLKPAMDRVTSTIDSKVRWHGKKDLISLLRHSCRCNASDSRDKVFAFIGLADPAYGILPDYTHPIDQVLIDTTIKIIQTEGSLEVLRLVADTHHPWHNSTLPSWVLDVTCREVARSIQRGYLDQEKSRAFILTLNTSHGALQALQVDGILLDRLLDSSTSGVPVDRFVGDGYYYVSPRGSAAFCSNPIQNNGEIWILKGCSSPLVLRAHGRYGYTLVSNATMRPFGAEKSLKWAKERSGGWQGINIV